MIYFKTFLTNIFFFIPFICFSQIQLNGFVKDSASNERIFANIIIKSVANNAIISYTSTSPTGEFAVEIPKTGEFKLLCSTLAYKDKVLNIDSKNLESNDFEISLSPKFIELNEVRIEKKILQRIKSDTIIFDAQSFSHGNEEVVEDLLKKIPGITIDSEGTIKVGNKEVEKVMVEGDDFFDRGYKLLTKNMPSNPIKKVEVLKNYSNNHLLKGVEESDKVALNLTLDEDAKRLWFGNIEGGYGLFSKNRYSVRGNLMNFGKKNKYYFLTNLNNTGYDATGDINQLVRPYRTNEAGSIGDDQQIDFSISLNEKIPDFKSDRINFNNTELLSFNAIFNPTNKLKIKTLGFFNWDENLFFKNTIQNYQVNQTSFTNNEDYNLKKIKYSGFGKIQLRYDISKTSSIEGTSKYNSGYINSSSDLLFNNVSTRQVLDTRNKLIDQKISYTNKFRKKKVFILTGRFINEESPKTYRLNRFFFQDLFANNNREQSSNIEQSIQNLMQYAGVEAHYLDRKKNRNLLEIKIGNQFRQDNLNSYFHLNNANENTIQKPLDFQNRTNYINNNLYLKSKYKLEVSNKFAINGNLHFQYLYNQLEYNEFFESENLFFLNPSLGFEWEINEGSRVKSTYTYNTTNSTIGDVYNGFILTDFRSFEKGTGDLNQLDESTWVLNYELGKWSDRFFANTFFIYTKNNDFFSSNSVLTENYSLSEKVLFRDREYFSVNSNIDRYFKIIRSNLKLSLTFAKSNYKNKVNGLLREIDSKNYSYGFELRSGFTGFFNYHFGSKWTGNTITTKEFNNSFINNVTFVDLMFFINNIFNFQFKGERYYFGNFSSKNSYLFLDVDASYSIKPNKITLTLEARNLFDTQTFQNFVVSDVGTSTTTYRLLPRFALLKLKYRF
ncbi:MAG: TonB-dependent receptor [Salegentibacter mishustinae]|nr:TonB-dependent receptor [Salegentibacter mishustinae]